MFTDVFFVFFVSCFCCVGFCSFSCDCHCQRTTDEKVVDIELQTSDYIGQDLTSFDRFYHFNHFYLLFFPVGDGYNVALLI